MNEKIKNALGQTRKLLQFVTHTVKLRRLREEREELEDESSELSDKLDSWILDLASSLFDTFELESEEDALDAVFELIEILAEEEECEPIPEMGADDTEIAEWLGKADTSGLKALVLELASEMAE